VPHHLLRHNLNRPWKIGLLVLAVLLGALATAEILEWPFLRAPVRDALSRALERPVQLEAPFGVRLVGSLRIRSGLLVIGPQADAAAATPSGPAPDLLRAREARITLPYATVWQLWRGASDQAAMVDVLAVEHLQATLLRDAQGRVNWRLGPAKPSETAAAVPPPLPQFGLLQVRSGEIAYDDAIEELSLKAALRTQEGSTAPTREAAQAAAPPASAAAGLDVQAQGSHRKLPLSASLQSSGLLPLVRRTEGGTAAAPIRLDLRMGRAHLKLVGSATDVMRLGGLDGEFDLAGPSLAAVGTALGLTLPTTAPFEMHGRVRKQGTIWSAEIGSLRVGSSRLRGDFRYETAGVPPLLRGTLAGERLVLADLGPTIGAGAGEGQPKPQTPSSGRILPQREFDIPSLRRMNADVQLQLDRLDLGTPQLESLAPLRGRLQLTNGVLGVQDLLAQTSRGTVRGMIKVDAREQGSPLWQGDLRWGGIDLERFVKSRNPRSAEAKPGPAGAASAPRAPGYISGLLGGSAQFRGQGRSIAGVMSTLDGSAGLWVRDGRLSHLVVELAGIDLAESLGIVLTGDRSLPLRCAVAQMSLRDGRAVADTALIDTADTTLVVKGHVSLADESLALVMAAQPHDVSLVALRTPVHIEGSFALPRVRLEKRTLAKRLAGAAALALIAPPAALLGLVDLGEDDRQQCAEALKRLQTSVATSRRPEKAR
jgi:uncharacterized protein involved in outer membrane biogenesis